MPGILNGQRHNSLKRAEDESICSYKCPEAATEIGAIEIRYSLPTTDGIESAEYFAASAS